VTARVASLALHTLCVNANKTELAPIVYEAWPNARHTNGTLEDSDGKYWP
jgi:hypothetical protein